MITKNIFFLIFLSLHFAHLVFTKSEICGDWNELNAEKCFQLIDKQNVHNFDSAVKLCEKHNSTLISIHSKQDQHVIDEYLFKNNKVIENVWIGLKYESNYTFKWSDKSHLNYNNWVNGYPDYDPNENCVQISSEKAIRGKWSDESCNKNGLALCQRVPNYTKEYLINKVKEQKAVIDFLKIINKDLKTESNKYFIDDDQSEKFIFQPTDRYGYKNYTSFEKASALCSKYNSRLVEIKSDKKKTIISDYVNQYNMSEDSFWLNARLLNRTITWLSGLDWDYHNWTDGREATYCNYTQEYTYVQFRYNALSCATSYNYAYALCETELNI